MTMRLRRVRHDRGIRCFFRRNALFSATGEVFFAANNMFSVTDAV